MALVRVVSGNRARLGKLRQAVNALPVAERALWAARVAAKLRSGPVGTFAVAGGGATGDWSDGAGAEREWDLELANWLDGTYTVVSDRVSQVARSAGAAVSSAGWSLWPLAAAALAIALAMSIGKKAATR